MRGAGRKIWLFLGSGDSGAVNASIVSLIANCELHGLEPLAYLQDLLCLIPNWPVQRVLERAPANWATTIAAPEVAAELGANVYREGLARHPQAGRCGCHEVASDVTDALAFCQTVFVRIDTEVGLPERRRPGRGHEAPLRT